MTTGTDQAFEAGEDRVGCLPHARAGYDARPHSTNPGWPACAPPASKDDSRCMASDAHSWIWRGERGVDGVVTRSLTGHVTVKMHLHYSSVAMDEKRAAVAAVAELIRAGGDHGGDRPPEMRNGRMKRRRTQLAETADETKVSGRRDLNPRRPPWHPVTESNSPQPRP